MSLQGLKVLIIEDDPIICEHITQLISIQGAQIIGRAHQGLRALDMLNNLEPDFVICDINLEDHISGLEIAEVIDDKYKLPYIFLTSYDDEKTVQEAQRHSPYGYLVKPFQDRTLITTIKIALSNHQKQMLSVEFSKESIEAKIDVRFTDQEYVILEALVAGKTYKDIAESINLSRDSVKYHAGKIYTKCGIKGRSELACQVL